MDPRIQVKLDKYQKCGNIISQTSLLSSYTGSETDADSSYTGSETDADSSYTGSKIDADIYKIRVHPLTRASMEAVHWVLEQDTLSAA